MTSYVDRDSIAVLSRGWPEDLDLLVIDVEGNDYWVWQAASRRSRPRVVVIEYNGSFGPHLHWVARYDPRRRWDESVDHGASLAALVALGRERGYRLVYCDASGTNAFFVREDSEAGFADIPPACLFQPPVHKLPNGHPPVPPNRRPTSPTATPRDVTLRLVWLERCDAPWRTDLRDHRARECRQRDDRQRPAVADDRHLELDR